MKIQLFGISEQLRTTANQDKLFGSDFDRFTALGKAIGGERKIL